MKEKQKNLIKLIPIALICLVAAILYCGFFSHPMMRTAGDEKVYIAQALEMEKAGHWFLQTLANEPNYYKGPLHYILIRVGFILFGKTNLWPALWMNVGFLLIAAIMLYHSSILYLKNSMLSFLCALILLSAPGILSHAFASQMEVELVGIYGMILALMIYSKKQKVEWCDVWMWILIGLASWVKSPIHSVLLTITTLFYHWFENAWNTKVMKFSYMSLIILGIIIGMSAYISPVLHDFENFWQTYILRESLSKGANGVGLIEAFIPNYTFHLGFWSLLILPGICIVAKKIIQCRIIGESSRVVSACLSMIIPTTLFFLIHSYRGAIYTLPVLPAVILIGLVGYNDILMNSRRQNFIVQIAMFMLSCLVTLIILHIDRILCLGEICSENNSLYFPLLFFTLTSIFFYFVFYRLKEGPIFQGFYVCLVMMVTLPGLFLMKKVGEFEVNGLRTYAKMHQKDTLAYYNVNRFLWSEWGLLNLSVGMKILPAHDFEQLLSYLDKGVPVIIDKKIDLDILKSKYSDLFAQLDVSRWKRWKTHIMLDAHSQKALNPLSEDKRTDLGFAQRDAFIIKKNEPTKL
jgi:hypothetical protein